MDTESNVPDHFVITSTDTYGPLSIPNDAFDRPIMSIVPSTPLHH